MSLVILPVGLVILPGLSSRPALALAPTPIPTAVTGTVLQPGQTVRGLIAAKPGTQRFAIMVASGATISLGVFPDVGSPLVPAFDLYAPNGSRVLSANAVANVAGGAVSMGYSAPATGAYILYVQGYKGQTTGGFVLVVGDGWTLTDVDAGPIQPDQQATGQLIHIGDRAVWTVDLPENADIEITVAPLGPGKVDPVLDLRSPAGKIVASAHDSSPAHTAHVPTFTTPTAGTYQIRVSSFLSKTVGSYTLLVKILQVIPTATVIPVINVMQTGQVKQGEQFSYAFPGVPGEVVQILANAKIPGQFDPVIELFGPSGRRIALADDLPGGLSDPTDAVLRIALDDGVGMYTVQVYGYALMPGEFTLIVRSE